MSASNQTENALALLLFNNTNFALVGDSSGLKGSDTAGSFHIALHGADPGEGGDQTSSESTYTGYNRVAIARASSTLTVTGGSVANSTTVTFAQCTAGNSTAVYFSIGLSTYPSTGQILVSGALTAPLSISNLITPQFTSGTLTNAID